MSIEKVVPAPRRLSLLPAFVINPPRPKPANTPKAKESGDCGLGKPMARLGDVAMVPPVTLRPAETSMLSELLRNPLAAALPVTATPDINPSAAVGPAVRPTPNPVMDVD